MSHAWFVVGDALTELRRLDTGSVDLVLTSPPFLALRSYLPADHPAKSFEYGSEPSPAVFIDRLLDVVEECRRVLAPHGSLVVELGDTYCGARGYGSEDGNVGVYGERSAERWRESSVAKSFKREDDGWPQAKSLTLIPEAFRFALAYGRNPHNGRPTPPWRIRNVVRWHRPNPPVGALGDKFRPSTTDLVVACMSKDRYFDLDAVRTAGTEPGAVKRHSVDQHNPGQGWTANNAEIRQNPDGAPPLDTWIIPTAPYPGAHYATYPEQLCVIPIKAMCPLRVCQTCGQPSRRIVDIARNNNPDDSQRKMKAAEYRLNGHGQPPEIGWEMTHTTVGWTDCGHDNWRTGIVCDPFAGSGTTLAVAVGHGRDAIGIDLDERNAWLAQARLGMLITIETPDPTPA